MPDDSIRLNISANASEATGQIKAVPESIVQLDGALKAAGESGAMAGVQISEGMAKAAGSTTEAREAARLLSEKYRDARRAARAAYPEQYKAATLEAA